MKTQKSSEQPYPDPPSDLSPAARELWIELGPTSARCTGRRELLTDALRWFDVAQQCRAAIALDGLVVNGPKMPHANPSVGMLKEASREWARLWKLLSLDKQPDPMDFLL